MRTRRSTRRARRAHGFTLLELMVSLTIGGLAISAMYTIGSALVRQYHQQQQAANAMTTLRVALDQVKRDIARAGYMSTPNLIPSGFPSVGCETGYPQHVPVPGSGALAAISRFTADFCGSDASCSNVHADINTNRTNGFTADEIVMFGNYETSSEYPNVQLINTTTVSVGRSAHAYQTDFTQWWSQGNSTAPDVDAFRRAFAPGRMLRIRTTGGLQHYAVISGVTDQTGANDARVTFDRAIPAPCVAGTDGAWIAPISAIRYYPRNDPNPPSPNPWGPMAQLVREEVQPGDKMTPLGLTEPTNNAYTYTNTRVLLDYLVSFNLGFVVSTGGGPADVYTPGNDTATANTVNTTPERVRAVTIELSARTPQDDRALAPGTCANLGCFQITANRPAAARVRTLRTEVFIPNIAFESY